MTAVGFKGREAGDVEGEAGEETQSGGEGIDGAGGGELGEQGVEEFVERAIEIEVASDGEFETASFSVLAEAD